MNRLSETTRALRDRGARPLVPFLTAGWPDEATFVRLVGAVAGAGCPLLEIGVPFSDPVADGPVIQAASQQALAAGVTLEKSLALAAAARRDHGLDVVLMGYLNPVLHMGPAAFARACAEAGVAGVIVPDLPLEEDAGVRRALDAQGVDLVSLVAPTTDEERLRRHAAAAAGFLYLVSTTGVTGRGAEQNDHLEAYVARVRAASDLPLYVGFGIGRPEQAARVAAVADGAIVGSALLRAIDADRDGDPVGAATRLLTELSTAMESAKGERS